MANRAGQERKLLTYRILPSFITVIRFTDFPLAPAEWKHWSVETGFFRESAEGMLTNHYGIRGGGEGRLDFPLLLNVGKEK